MTLGSLFSGIGGFDLGLERAGFDVRWQVEIDPFCRRVLEKHWPSVRRYEDVRTVGAHNLEPVECIAGGFPCKQTSVGAAITRRRVGLAGADSGLWRHMRRIVGELQPRAVVVENPDSEWLNQVQGDLAGLGYDVARHETSAARVGAPHLRERVFLVAHTDGARLAERRTAGPSEAESGARTPAERNPWLLTLAGVLRVDDGLSSRLDRRQRINGLGNAVVPQCAEVIGRAILQSLTPERDKAPRP